MWVIASRSARSSAERCANSFGVRAWASTAAATAPAEAAVRICGRICSSSTR